MGAVLMCPAVRAVLPPAPVVYFFRYVLAPLCPKALVPAMFEKSQKPENLFTSKENTMKFYLDHWGREGGLSWGKSIRIGTADQLLTMCSLVEKSLPKITFPFLVIHDPEDQVGTSCHSSLKYLLPELILCFFTFFAVEFAGTQLLLEKSATPTDIYRGRELHEMLGEKHDLMSNCGDKTFAIICDWLTDRLANCFEKTPTI
jgi:pimeloyl-ACP methyl ester carboxylesterase